ncbi:MAG: GNAT family N-acetyltransferase [Tepidisphaeraceae bacterium]|jgi:uncharacterized protein
MRVNRYQDAAEFAERVTPLLMRDETVNHLLLGILSDLSRGSPTQAAREPLLCDVEEERGVPIAAAASTGLSLVLTDMPPGAMDALVDFLCSENISISKTCGTSEAVARFAVRWAARNDLKATLDRRLHIMRLESVTAKNEVPGHFRQATMADVPILTPWAEGFTAELQLELSDARTDVERRIGRDRLFVWCDPQPVSMAGCAGPTPNGIRINFVYTPPEFRRRGYAGACVAALSRRMLEAGKKFVFLYVDAGNATTNRIYRAIGFEPVCAWDDYHFQADERRL